MLARIAFGGRQGSRPGGAQPGDALTRIFPALAAFLIVDHVVIGVYDDLALLPSTMRRAKILHDLGVTDSRPTTAGIFRACATMAVCDVRPPRRKGHDPAYSVASCRRAIARVPR